MEPLPIVVLTCRARQLTFTALDQFNNTASAYRVFWFYGPGNNTITIVAITAHP